MMTILRPSLKLGRCFRRKRFCRPNVAAAILSFRGFHVEGCEGKGQDDYIPKNCPIKLYKRFAAAPCYLKQLELKNPQPEDPNKLIRSESSIPYGFFDKCCETPCEIHFPRYDDMFYRRTDKNEREYQQSWNECPEMMKQPKVICCLEPEFPLHDRREKQPRIEGAVPRRMECADIIGRCPKIKLVKCRRSRQPPSCKIWTTHRRCGKTPNPYPAFSECHWLKPSPCRPIECKCFAIPTMCEVWSQFHYQTRAHLISKLDRASTLQRELINQQMVHFHNTYRL